MDGEPKKVSAAMTESSVKTLHWVGPQSSTDAFGNGS